MGVTTAADLASLEDGDLRKAGLNIVQTRKLRAAIEVGLTMLQFTSCVVTHLQLPYD